MKRGFNELLYGLFTYRDHGGRTVEPRRAAASRPLVTSMPAGLHTDQSATISLLESAPPGTPATRLV